METKKGTVRLLSVSERSQQLFGRSGAAAVARQWERGGESPQLQLFPEEDGVPAKRGRGRRRTQPAAGEEALSREATTLDRVHAAMLMQAGGQANALRALLRAEQERGPDFERLANALTALYPRASEEKRLLDAMLLAMPR